MNLSLDISKKIRISGKALFLSWFKWSRKFFALLFFATLAMGAYTWYENVISGGWSAEEKSSYAETAFRETVFDEPAFRRAVDAVNRRASSHEQDITVGRDLFVSLSEAAQ